MIEIPKNSFLPIFLILLTLFIFSHFVKVVYSSETISIQITSFIQNKELIVSEDAIKELSDLSTEYKEKIHPTNTFNKEFYQKMESFVKKYKNTYSAISALYITAGMCFLENTEKIYTNDGMKIIDFIINNFPSSSFHYKQAIFYKATYEESQQNYENSFKILKDNYEVIISREDDKYWASFLKELNHNKFKPTDGYAQYYYYMAKLCFNLAMFDKGKEYCELILKNFPNSNYKKMADELLNIETALEK